ncbi:helix-turn-helix transcriptional regulator [Providencia alcalifaciens]
MDIENRKIEKISARVKLDLYNYFDWNDIDIHYTVINVDERNIYTLSSDYEWQLIYWHHDMDLSLKERLFSGVQYWCNYSDAYQKILTKLDKGNKKIDICNRYNNLFEIFSLNANHKVPYEHLLTLYQWRSIVSEYAYKQWSENKTVALPLRQKIELDEPEPIICRGKETSNFIRFGQLSFSNKEALTIRLLLSHRNIKEISRIQGCSEDEEYRRLNNIKKKLNCEMVSQKECFSVMKEHGITLASLEKLMPIN